MATIEAKGLVKVFPLKEGGLLYALRGVDFFVRDGEFVCLLGPSGCGKSTLLNILSGLDPGYEGTVIFDGVLLKGMGKRGAPRVGYVFQEPRLLPWRTVRGNVEFALESEGIPRAQWGEVLQTHLALVGLQEFAGYYPHQLSGGMQQRVAIARALALDPEILLMDEPFGALDELTRIEMQGELLRVWSTRKKTVVFVTHSITEALMLSDRVVLLTARPGRVRQEFEVTLPRPRERTNPQLIALYEEIWRNLT